MHEITQKDKDKFSPRFRFSLTPKEENTRSHNRTKTSPVRRTYSGLQHKQQRTKKSSPPHRKFNIPVDKAQKMNTSSLGGGADYDRPTTAPSKLNGLTRKSLSPKIFYRGPGTPSPSTSQSPPTASPLRMQTSVSEFSEDLKREKPSNPNPKEKKKSAAHLFPMIFLSSSSSSSPSSRKSERSSESPSLQEKFKLSSDSPVKEKKRGHQHFFASFEKKMK